ncbi:MAG: tRNA (adenosine(37)-N6)-threonylcarbamoyltransferase complex transferase subunit TsaD [Alphaproteobacteria bacterium]|nr:tRNA (adenosine(37)-N6)-threonylcarbamoyltransferase complex transferase subunit TsaD [Alphaproteobacteria bacterium]
MIVLGIETSCDETAVAIVDEARTRRADLVLSQTALHRPFGGIVPELAARAHLDHLEPMVGEALQQAGVTLAAVDAIAATVGPGLIGGLLVGATTAKAMALASGKPFVAVNHLEGHALSARLDPGLDFPYLLLLVSGGHCQLLIVEGVGRYVRLGTTIDDAIGEAFDKTAKLLGLPYPGGPAIESLALHGDARRFRLPRPLAGRPGCDFSFAGLKTAVRILVEGFGPAGPGTGDAADIAAGFQAACADVLADRAAHAMALARARLPGIAALVVAGGVAANRALRTRLEAVASAEGFALVAPPPRLCTDNAAMIAWAGLERFRLGHTDGLDIAARPRWPLDPAAPPAPGAGVKA